MFYWLLLVFLIVPALEITLFIWIGGYIGPWWVFGIIIGTGILGVAFAKAQGLEALKKARESMSKGIPPGDYILDGIVVLIAGILLFIPGFFTDVIGFVLLVPFTRKPLRNLLKFILINKFSKSTVIYRKKL